MNIELTNLIKQHSPLSLSENILSQFDCIASYLKQENEKYNLTSLETIEETAILHFVDSLTLFSALISPDTEKQIVDVGCGAGFPSLVIAAVAPRSSVTALDSTAKKVTFVKECATQSGINNIIPLAARAEEAGRSETHREKYDIAVSRGVARLSVLAELCLPLIKVGGIFIAMKGKNAREELDNAKAIIKKLGCEVSRIDDNPMPIFDRTHTLITIKKVSPTPKAYPRSFAKIIQSK